VARHNVASERVARIDVVVRALEGNPDARLPFGAPAPASDLAAAITTALALVASPSGSDELLLTLPRGLTRPLNALAFAHGWDVLSTDSPTQVRLRPARP